VSTRTVGKPALRGHAADASTGSDVPSSRRRVRRSGRLFRRRVDDVEPVVAFLRRRVDDVRPVVTNIDPGVSFVHPFRWFVDPVGCSRRRSVGDLDPFCSVVRPTCRDSRRSVTDVWHRRADVESVDEDLDPRRRDLRK